MLSSVVCRAVLLSCEVKSEEHYVTKSHVLCIPFIHARNKMRERAADSKEDAPKNRVVTLMVKKQRNEQNVIVCG